MTKQLKMRKVNESAWVSEDGGVKLHRWNWESKDKVWGMHWTTIMSQKVEIHAATFAGLQKKFNEIDAQTRIVLGRTVTV